MTSRRLGLAACAVALGVLSATGWRLHLGAVDTIAGLQAMWGLGAWLAGRLHTGRPGRGAIAGGLFGLAALAAYYLTEVVVDSVHSATSQLAASGRFWVPAALLGGSVLGMTGTAAGLRARGRWLEPAALSHAVMAAALLAEAWFLHDVAGEVGQPGRLATAAGVLVAIAVVIAVAAWRRTGPRALVAAAVLVAGVTPAATAVFLVLEHRFGYVTI
jgi:hypothetical protein